VPTILPLPGDGRVAGEDGMANLTEFYYGCANRSSLSKIAGGWSLGLRSGSQWLTWWKRG